MQSLNSFKAVQVCPFDWQDYARKDFISWEQHKGINSNFVFGYIDIILINEFTIIIIIIKELTLTMFNSRRIM